KRARTAGNALNLSCGVDLCVDRAPCAVIHLGNSARFAEIDAAGEFTDDQDVETGNDLGLERGRILQRIETDRGAKIGEELEILAQAQQPAFGLLVKGVVVPFG